MKCVLNINIKFSDRHKGGKEIVTIVRKKGMKDPEKGNGAWKLSTFTIISHWIAFRRALICDTKKGSHLKMCRLPDITVCEMYYCDETKLYWISLHESRL